MISATLATVLVSIGITLTVVLLISQVVYRAPLLQVQQSQNVLLLTRVIAAGAAAWLVSTAPFVKSSLYLASTGYSAQFYTDLGPFGQLFFTPWIQAALSQPSVLLGIQVVTASVLVLVLIGYRTRFTMPAAIVLYTIVLATLLKASSGGHLGLQPLYLLIVLWILNEAIHYVSKRNDVESAWMYTHAVYVIWVAIAVPYIFAVTNKLKVLGFDWFAPDNIRGYLHINEYVGFEYWQWSLTVWSASWPDSIFYLGGAAVVFTQLIYPLIIVSHRAKVILSALVIIKHIAIYCFLGFLFYDLILIQLIILYSFYAGQTSGTVRMKRSLPMVYKILLCFMIFLPTYQTVLDETWFPIKNWALYYKPSMRASYDAFEYMTVQLTHASGAQTRISVPALKELADIYSYPLARCYWSHSVAVHLDDCQLYFSRVITSLNQDKHTEDPYTVARLQFYDVSLAELRSTPFPWPIDRVVPMYTAD